MWVPEPRDTSKVQLPAEVLELAEELAAHAHDVWAAGRWREGWRFGETRDDHKKQTPNMVPYAALPAAEQKYDRSLSLETLRLLALKGYRLVPTRVPGDGRPADRRP